MTDKTDTNSTLGDEIDEELPDEPLSTADHDSRLATIADELRGGIVKMVVALLVAISRVVPFSERFWRGMINAGYRGLKKKSGCEYIGHVLVGGEIKHVPMTYDYETDRFENRHGDWWKAPDDGSYEYRVAGRVPAVWASARSNHLGSHVQAEVAEVLDVGGGQEVFRNAQLQQVTQLLSPDANGQQARADGGGQVVNSTISVQDPGVFEDFVVPLDDGLGNGAGRVVSMEKYYETYPSVVDPEEMQMQEQRGRLAEQDRDYGKLALKMLLVCGGIIAAVVLGPPLINALLGGGGGGGGGAGATILPGMLGALGVL